MFQKIFLFCGLTQTISLITFLSPRTIPFESWAWSGKRKPDTIFIVFLQFLIECFSCWLHWMAIVIRLESSMGRLRKASGNFLSNESLSSPQVLIFNLRLAQIFAFDRNAELFILRAVKNKQTVRRSLQELLVSLSIYYFRMNIIGDILVERFWVNSSSLNLWCIIKKCVL